MQFFKFRLRITLRARKVQLRRITKVQCVVDQGAGKPAAAPAIVLQRNYRDLPLRQPAVVGR